MTKALPTPTLLFLALNLSLPRPTEVQTLYASTHDALRDTLLKRSGDVAVSTTGPSLFIATAHSEEEMQAHLRRLPGRPVVLLTSSFELYAPRNVTLLRFADIDPQESLVIDLAPGNTYALSSKARGLSFDPFLSSYDVVHVYEPVDTLLLVEALIKVAFKRDALLAEKLETLFVTLLSTHAEGYLVDEAPEQLESYLGLLRRLAEFKDEREGSRLLVSERFAPLSRKLAGALDLGSTEREALYQALGVLDLSTDSSLISAPPRKMGPNLLLTLTRTLLNRYRLVPGAGTDPPLAAHIVRAVQDYLRLGGDVAALKQLRREVGLYYDERVFKMLSQAERQAALSYTSPTLQGEAGGEDLFGILQMAQAMARSGTFVFKSGRRRGWVGVNRGEVTSAETGALEGEEALLEMFTWEDISFSLYDLEAVMLHDVKRSTNELMLMGARYLDNVRTLEAQGFEPNIQLSVTRDGTPQQFAGLFNVLQFDNETTFRDLLAQGYKKRWLLEGLAHLSRENLLSFRPELPKDAPPETRSA